MENPPPRPPVKPPPLLGTLPVKPPFCGPWKPVNPVEVSVVLLEESLREEDFSSALLCPLGGVT